MLDTNTVSHIIKNHQTVIDHMLAVPPSLMCVSSLTEGEILFGHANRPEARSFARLAREFMRRIDVLPWDRVVAECYGPLRAGLQSRGKVLGTIDLLIAAHALAIGAVLVTDDRAFPMVAGLKVVNWLDMKG